MGYETASGGVVVYNFASLLVVLRQFCAGLQSRFFIAKLFDFASVGFDFPVKNKGFSGMG